MRPQLAWEYQSVDVEDLITEGRETLDTWVPEDPFDVAISLIIHIVPANSSARDLFEAGIYTPKKIKEGQK